MYQDPAVRCGGGGVLVKPSAAEQKARHDHKFREISNSFQDLTTSIRGMEPEQVIVLETLGESVEKLVNAAKQIPGLEWLTEIDLDDCEPCDDFQDEKDAAKKQSRRLYLMMSNQQAMIRLASLWQEWCADPDKRATNNYGPFKNIFIHLKDIRRWSVRDRIDDTRVVRYWEETLKYARGNVRFEVELWCRGDDGRRRAAYEMLRGIIETAGGRCISQVLVTDILYYGVLAELPAAYIRQTVDQIMAQSYSHLLQCEDVMFFRPHGQSEILGHSLPEGEEHVAPAKFGVAITLPTGDPVVALVDGLPLERHEAIKGRMRIDDEDNHGSHYKPHQQIHGTEMASLIIRGDLSLDGAPLPRPVYVRPIFVPYEDFNKNVGEKTPDDQLLVDVMHRAVLRIDTEAPTVKAGPTHHGFSKF